MNNSYFNAVEVPFFLIFGCYIMLLYILVTSLEKCARVFPDASVGASAVAVHRHEWPNPDEAVPHCAWSYDATHTPAAVLRALPRPHQLSVLSDLVFTPYSVCIAVSWGFAFLCAWASFLCWLAVGFLFCEVPVQGVSSFLFGPFLLLICRNAI